VKRLAIGGLVLGALFCCGCGTSNFRNSQDWSGVTDARLLRTCHVGHYGSGLWLAHGPSGSYVLTVSHVVGDDDTMSVHLRNPKTDEYESYTGDVIERSHQHKEDLALLKLRKAPEWAQPFTTPVGRDMKAFEMLKETELMNIAFGAEKRPIVVTLPSTINDVSVRSVLADENGNTDWIVPKLLMYGGINEANSGSPAFAGQALVGLVESAPMFVIVREQGKADNGYMGIQLTAPNAIREFLKKSGHADLMGE
jgi:hypothetical protein